MPEFESSAPTSPDPAADAALDRLAGRRTRRAFLVGAGAMLAGLGGWRWLISQPPVDGVPGPLRGVLDANGRLSSAYFRPTRLAPEFAAGRAREPRKNGDMGLTAPLDLAAWRLRVQGYGGTERQFTLADIQALPRVQIVTELKCIEGWSVVVRWAGARLADFLTHYPLATRSGQPAGPGTDAADLAPYVGLATPDEGYYVGLDVKTALHPQTLLCYEMNGQPLSLEHGAPLRLVTPLKYGIKYLKRIGRMTFTDQRPNDFWAQRGYDWDSGH